ncbi:hypothetical protein [Pleomorphomonas koreensis]|uniref:hypothetical protein n=1 Tax=Pleomorphomonas koreensis TaxID=257440 RepID=UPI00146B7DB2|nr:hypothetical protein [Pleomorphomonas koreensis]
MEWNGEHALLANLAVLAIALGIAYGSAALFGVADSHGRGNDGRQLIAELNAAQY